MKRALLLLAAFAAAHPARADWTYDPDAKTLTSGNTGLVLNNVYVWGGKQLQIGDNGNRSDIVALDFTEPVSDDYTIRTILGKNTNDSTRDSAFNDCPNLTTLVTGDYPLYIDERAFDNCDALATVSIGKGCQSIGWGSFRNCGGPMVVAFAADSALTSIGQNAFASCTGLLSVDLSNCASLDSIGSGAFNGCTAMTTFTLPPDCKVASVTTSFQNCSSLQAIDLSGCSNLASIAEGAFLNNGALARVDLPASLTSLPRGAFKKHRSLSEGTAMLHVWFRSCPILDAKQNPFSEMFGTTKDYTVQESDYANASVTIHVPRAQATAGTPNWNSWAGAWQELADNSGTWARDDTTHPVFALPATVDGETLWVTDWRKTNQTYNDAAVKVVFWDDPVQVEVSGPEYDGSFVRRDYTTAEFSAKVLTYDTDSASHVTLTVTLYSDAAMTQSVGSASHDVSALGVATAFAFSGLSENTTYYASLSGVDSEGNEGGVIDLGSFTTKWEDAAWTYYPDKGTLEKGWIVVSNVTASGTALSVASGSNDGDTEIPALDFTGGIRDGYELVSVGQNAFRSCTALTNVVLPATVTTIGQEAFRYDDALLSFAAPGPVSIGNYCFYENDTITNAFLPNAVALNYRCFQSCKALRTIGTDLSPCRSLGQEALSNCSLLEGDFVLTNCTSFGTWLFNGSRSFTSAILGPGVTKVTTVAFSSCDSLTNVVVQGEISAIDGSAFGGHGPYNSHCSTPGHLNIYLTNVPDTLGNPFTSQYWNGNMASIDATNSTIVVHLPYYNGLLDGKGASDGTTDVFAAWARAWQKETLESIVARGCPATAFDLPATKAGVGQWRNDTAVANTAAYVVRLAYYTDPNQQNAATLLLIR